MAQIRWVCLSDTHFGAENSLLSHVPVGSTTVDPDSPSRVLGGLIECLRDVISRTRTSGPPTLILNGDMLELALAMDNISAMVFDRFIDLAYNPEAIFANEIIYLPGNHDHHLWETARELQYSAYVARTDPKCPLQPPWHSTRMFQDMTRPGLEAELLRSLVRRRPGPADRVRVVYPNLGITNPSGDRVVVFHHGHFVEPLYRLMSTVRAATFPHQTGGPEVWDWESDNFAWIDFFWSSLGRSGEVGSDVGLLYDMLQDPEAVGIIAANWATAVSQHLPRLLRAIPVLLRPLVRRVATQAVTRERQRTDTLLSPSAIKGLAGYLEGPTFRQLHREHPGFEEAKVTFVFGHTHKPFSDTKGFSGYHQAVDLFNTGGWVVDTERTAPLHGASAVVIDDQLNVASIAFHHQTDDPAQAKVTISGGPLAAELTETLDLDGSPWTDMSQIAFEEVRRRQQALAQIVAAGKAEARRAP